MLFGKGPLHQHQIYKYHRVGAIRSQRGKGREQVHRLWQGCVSYSGLKLLSWLPSDVIGSIKSHMPHVFIFDLISQIDLKETILKWHSWMLVSGFSTWPFSSVLVIWCVVQQIFLSSLVLRGSVYIYLLDDHIHNVPIHGIWNMLTVVVANNQFPELSGMMDLFMLLRNCLLQCESVVIFKYSNHNDCSVVVDGIIVGTGNFGAWKWLHSKFCFIYCC